MDGERENEGSRPGLSAAWREWIAPVAVAGAVALALAGTVELINGTGPRADKAQRAEQAERAGKRPPAQTLLADRRRAAPGFVVAVHRTGTAVVVRDLASGATIDQTMPPPAGQRFHQVAAAPDGSYLLSGYGRQRVAFYRLRLSGAGRAQSFTALPRAITGVSTSWSDMAVSADGDKVGYVTYQGSRPRLTVISLRSGAHRTWQAAANGRLGSLSWAGGALSFVWAPLPAPGGPSATRAGRQVRVLDTTAPGGDLRAGRVVLTLPAGGGAAVISRDGKTIVTATSDGSGTALAAFATSTGRRIRVLRRFAGAAGVTALTLDATGGHLLVTTGDGRVYADSTQPARRRPAAGAADVAW